MQDKTPPPIRGTQRGRDQNLTAIMERIINAEACEPSAEDRVMTAMEAFTQAESCHGAPLTEPGTMILDAAEAVREAHPDLFRKAVEFVRSNTFPKHELHQRAEEMLAQAEEQGSSPAPGPAPE